MFSRKNTYYFLLIWIPVAIGIQHISFAQTSWRQAQRQDATWYGSDEAIRIADQVLLYQRKNGGWIKNIDMASPLSEDEKQKLIQQKEKEHHATIDNGATYTQMRYLAKVYRQTNEIRFKNAFIKGLQFLHSIQYQNGGFPQDPFTDNYQSHITFNDNAMIGVLDLLKDIADEEALFSFVDTTLRSKSKIAVDKGVECILKTQIIVNGKKTAWCAQHDRQSLAPAPARTYEKISLSGAESVNVVRFLMRIENPSDEIKDAIASAVNWFEAAKLTGIKVEQKRDASLPRGYDRIVVRDENAGPLWARFYEIGTNKPIFCGRDGIIKDTLAEIEHERRVGYSWYTNNPEDLLTEDYPEWKSNQSKL